MFGVVHSLESFSVLLSVARLTRNRVGLLPGDRGPQTVVHAPRLSRAQRCSKSAHEALRHSGQQ